MEGRLWGYEGSERVWQGVGGSDGSAGSGGRGRGVFWDEGDVGGVVGLLVEVDGGGFQVLLLFLLELEHVLRDVVSLFLQDKEHLHTLLQLPVGAEGPLAFGEGLAPALGEGGCGDAEVDDEEAGYYCEGHGGKWGFPGGYYVGWDYAALLEVYEEWGVRLSV